MSSGAAPSSRREGKRRLFASSASTARIGPLPGETLGLETTERPDAAGEQPVSANKNLGIQNSGPWHAPGKPAGSRRHHASVDGLPRLFATRFLVAVELSRLPCLCAFRQAAAGFARVAEPRAARSLGRMAGPDARVGGPVARDGWLEFLPQQRQSTHTPYSRLVSRHHYSRRQSPCHSSPRSPKH